MFVDSRVMQGRGICVFKPLTDPVALRICWQASQPPRDKCLVVTYLPEITSWTRSITVLVTLRSWLRP